MTPTIYNHLIDALRREPKPLSTLYALLCDEGSTWSTDQLRLLLEVMQGVEISRDGDDPTVKLGERSPREELFDAIENIVRSQSGSPIPTAKVRAMLPSGIVTTEEEIKALAKENSALEVFGPGLIRLKDQ